MQNKHINQLLKNTIDSGLPIVDGSAILPYKSAVKPNESANKPLKEYKRAFVGKNQLPGVFNLLIKYGYVIL